MMSPKEMSALIRSKKRTAANAEPSLATTDASMNIKNPNDILNAQTDERIKNTLGSPDPEPQEPGKGDDGQMGLTEAEKKRMARLRSQLAGMKMSDR